MNPIKNLVVELKADENRLTEFIKDPIKYLEIEEKKSHPILNNKIFMTVVWMVGTALLLSIIFGALSIFIIKEDVNDFFIMIASASIGALAGLLVPSPSNNN